MTEEQRIKYENRYKELWLKQMVIDRKGNPMAREAPGHYNNGKNGNTGGRKKMKLSIQADIVNRLLNKRMLLREIADILGVSQQAVSDMKKRYGLPRAEEEVSGSQAPKEKDDHDGI